MFKIIVAALLFWPAIVAAESLKVTDGWARASIPGTENGAAYATLENPHDKTLNVTHISSDISQVAEVHRHVMSNDVMKMEAVKPLSIAPGEVIKFQPGGYHFMLFELTSPLKEEDTFSLILHFDSGAEQEIQFLVK
ncbi:MAG: copper chaperone PCu(A)C [Idiomarina sp.]|nr:copper chaperone PCu(A)C [Idiomarina sp.]